MAEQCMQGLCIFKGFPLGCIWAGDVDGDIIRNFFCQLEAEEVIVESILSHNLSTVSFGNVNPHRDVVFNLFQPADDGFSSIVIQPHPVDERLIFLQPETAGPGITG